MKWSSLVPFAAAAGALVIPEDGVWEQVAIESHQPSKPLSYARDSYKKAFDLIRSTKSDVREDIEHGKEHATAAFEHGLEAASEALDEQRQALDKLSVEGEALEDAVASGFPWWGRHGKPHKPEKTVYQMIAECEHTSKLAGLINEYDDLVALLNGTSANFTVFAPTNSAFDKIPEGAPKPSKEVLKKVLTYHVSGDFYPAGRLLSNPTVPTLLNGTGLSKDAGKTPQRLSYQVGWRGLTLNYLTRVIAIDIFGSNGVIHGVDSILIPPTNAAEIINYLPGEFSTLELGLQKTGWYALMNDTSTHFGGTLFAPTNWAFKKLGFKANAFLFSKWGEKCLAALLGYHVVANQTLYTDAFYSPDMKEAGFDIPKGKFHVDLPTLLTDRHLSIDIARFGGLIDFRINSFTGLASSNVIAEDGVVHVVNSVLIPPKKVGGVLVAWNGEELTEEDLRERLEPLIETAGDASDAPSGWDL